MIALFSYCIIQAQPSTSPIFEFRGVWIASVTNIDWPSKKNLSVADQQATFIELLNTHKQNGMNAVVVQIRPAGDALYDSPYEPWSEYLSGKQGKAPSPYYDPLTFMVEETHKLGMEFHAWINPYRAVFNVKTSSITDNHITKKHPNWFVTYGTTEYFNPGLPEVRSYLKNIVADIVSRYAIDAIHMDDYFYPYRIAKKEFDDAKTYQTYGNGLTKTAWRRSNCDSIVKELYQTIHTIKPKIKFGISPFGVWRNQCQDNTGSVTKAGQTCYDDLYADILLWLQKGWVDYIAPQLYWNRGHKLCDYDTLLHWWNQHTYGKHLYIGHAMYKAASNNDWKNKNELPNQINQLRKYTTTQGSIYFSSKDVISNPNGWCDSLCNNYYASPALLPPMPWIENVPPQKPSFVKTDINNFDITYNSTGSIKGFVLFGAPDHSGVLANMTVLKIFTSDRKLTIDTKSLRLTASTRFLFIASIDQCNNISSLVLLK